LSHRLSHSYRAFTGRDWQAPAAPGRPGALSRSATLASVARLADPNHSILIRALLDRESLSASAASTAAVAFDGLSSGPEAYGMIAERADRIREEAAFKFLEFRDRWRKRLAWIQLGPFLQRNQWFQAVEGGFAASGKGTRKDSKMLYLQALHDMASDCERQVSFLTGHMVRLQGDLAAVWHRESVRDDRSKLLPALEAALRGGEAELFKRLRLSLGDLAQETFVERVAKWDKRVFASEEELFRAMAWPWQNPRYRSGFDGFMEAFADLAEALCAAMLAHYEAKWDLFLRGLAPMQQTLALPAGSDAPPDEGVAALAASAPGGPIIHPSEPAA
jgi:hypothetical protein